MYNLRAEHETIRDDFEGRRQLLAGSEEQPMTFSAEEFRTLMPSLKVSKQNKVTIELAAGAHIDSNIQVSNAFVFCVSHRLDAKLARKFGYDAHYKITKPSYFAETVFWKLNEVVTLKGFKIDTVRYIDKIVEVTEINVKKIENDFWDICLTKPTKFCEEQEFRMVFVPQFKREIKPLLLSCPELRSYCAF